ncbi:hypothetical protein LV457_08990 [Mycobacterium sp. MYCO198283]|uniref:hypothetical protein n=1 Tax=Mycobacterium sp. MYCO198283 TaxID=2883505 RepID=UPI001E4F9E9D|nr:hypothetical protein [Mycobacterium sp. MYCO198283]MCG5432428.1 hypothetical protein [Mycobacterium sp. MYCO198283]
MPAQSAAIEVSHPPEAMLRVVNPVLKRVLRTPLGGVLTEFMVVSFTGRKTGRRYSVPVSAHHLDGELYVLLVARWKYNFKNGAPADVLYRGKSTPMRGELIRDWTVVGDVGHRLAASYGVSKAQRAMGLKFRDGKLPTIPEFAEATDRIGLSAIKLTPLQ